MRDVLISFIQFGKTCCKNPRTQATAMALMLPLFFVAPSFAGQGSGAVTAPPPNVYKNFVAPTPQKLAPVQAKVEEGVIHLDNANRPFYLSKADKEKFERGLIAIVTPDKTPELAPMEKGPFAIKWKGQKTLSAKVAAMTKLPPDIQASPAVFQTAADATMTIFDPKQPDSGPLRQDMKRILPKDSIMKPIFITLTANGPYAGFIARTPDGQELQGFAQVSDLYVKNPDGSISLFFAREGLQRKVDKRLEQQNNRPSTTPNPKGNKAGAAPGAGS